MPLDFEKICRICMEEHKHSHDIFKKYFTKYYLPFSEILSTYTKIKPSLEDGLPRNICRDCGKKLKQTYLFNIQCETSDKKLRQFLKPEESDHNHSEIKSEDVKIGENNTYVDFGLPLTNITAEEIDEDSAIKLEPVLDENKEEEDVWDAEDDNNLFAYKLQQQSDLNNDGENGYIEEKPRTSKRGRKKKVLHEDRSALRPSKMPHQCDVCGKILSTKSNLKAHKICHTDLRPYKCAECDASFKGYSALYQHKKSHTGETPYHCEYCPKQFGRRTGLVNHIRIHTGEKSFNCEVCCKSFAQSSQLSTHMRRHKGEKPFLCQQCGKGFPLRAELRVHQRIHNGEKPYACHLCTKTFATAGNLSIHIRIHKKEVRYKCDICQRGFVTCSAFKVHLKRHKGQRDYVCECGKTFYTSSALNQHKVVHTGEKKYQCKICGRKFSQTSHLSRHFKRDHMKPNMPVPSSNYFKKVLSDTGPKEFYNNFDIGVVNDVKCEAS